MSVVRFPPALNLRKDQRVGIVRLFGRLVTIRITCSYVLEPSKDLMRGFGSKACCPVPGPDLLFVGIALSDNASMKSLTIKSLFENVSMLKLGALGKIDLPGPEGCAISVNNWRKFTHYAQPCKGLQVQAVKEAFSRRARACK